MTNNNHPEHGPVSLDRLHQISEILSKAAAQSDGGNGREQFEAWILEKLGRERREYDFAMGKFLHGDNYADSYTRHMWNAWSAGRAAMLQAGNFREIPDSSTNNCREIAETSTNEHGIETHALLKHIEGMEVSVDVSTCDADAGHRYFGTVTEISELDTAKNGYILLVQDAKPNFKQADNSPVTPDGWIPVSDRMPPNKPGSYEYIVFESLNNRAHHDYWNVPDGSCDDFSPFWNHYGKYVTHWMPLPAAPQQEE